MPVTQVPLDTLSDLAALPVDEVIDVRAPAEWAEDHVPGALSLPVLDDAERARVGTIYTQRSPFLARKIGAALVAQNAARHLMGPLADRDGGWQPLVYCWRGGQRSGSFATILSQIGWRVSVLQGGYKTYRRLVVAAVREGAFPASLTLIDGNTGTAKTDILQRLARLGVQVLDLEGMALHRGSLFGAMPGGQPSQKAFESVLAQALAALDPARPVVAEAESSRIGAVDLPPVLWKAMQGAPRITLRAPLRARAVYLATAYADLTADAAALARRIESLRPLQPAEVIEAWLAMAARRAHVDLAEGLMARHYDPRYAKHRARATTADITDLDLPDLTETTRDATARRIAELLAR